MAKSLSLWIAFFACLFGSVKAEMRTSGLLCQYTQNPLGIDTLKPRLSWTLIDDRRNEYQSSYQIQVASSSEDLFSGKNLLWDTGRVDSDKDTNVLYNGKVLQSGQRCYWKVRSWDKQGVPTPWSDTAMWRVALLEPSDWKAKWIGPEASKGESGELPKDCPRLRKSFFLSKPVLSATASICGLGFYELYLNGRKAGDRVLAPANSHYEDRLLFDTLDVTADVKEGVNAVGIWLAPGYSDDYSKWGWRWLEGKRALFQLNVVYKDGSTDIIASDGSWKAGSSPITSASLYNGEFYDAGLEKPDWSTSDFNSKDWNPVSVLAPTKAKLAPNVGPPIRVMKKIRPISVTEPTPGVFVFDLGQNIAGWVRLCVSGTRGTHITLRHSELIGSDGRIDPWTNRRAKATDVFVLGGTGKESYEPRFTYHGFRYVEVTGYPGRPTCDDLIGCVVHADVPVTGSFTSSDGVINQIHSNCLWSMLNNFMSIPTDCPVRDERTPCQMDSMAYEDAALCNFAMMPFYNKWLGDIRGFGLHPDWRGDTIFLPWRLYRQSGDASILAANYPAMRDYIEKLNSITPDYIYTNGFGDWCPPSGTGYIPSSTNNPRSYFRDVTDVNTTIYSKLAGIVGQSAEVLGKTKDAERYGALSLAIAKAYNEKRFNAQKATYGEGGQTTSIMPLAFQLVPKDKRSAVFENLTRTIKENNNSHLDTGIFGTRYLLDVLFDGGAPDLAISMLKQPTFPSFGNQIAQGATTLWECWTFRGGMNSHDHAMFAGADSSFFTRLAGITALTPGFDRILIKPVIPAALSFVEATEDTPNGQVSVRWQKKVGNFDLWVKVPPNSTAIIGVPTSEKDSVMENGRLAGTSEGVVLQGMESGHALFSVGSGSYHFTAKP